MPAQQTLNILISVTVRWWNASAYYAITAAEALVKQGHRVTVLAPEETPAFRQASRRNLTVIGNIHPAKSNPLTFLRTLGSLYDLIHHERFDILNPHRPEDHFALALAKKRLPDPPCLIRTVSDVRAPKRNLLNALLHRNGTDGIIYSARACQNRYHRVFDLKHLPEAIIYSALDMDDMLAGNLIKNNPFRKYSRPRITMVARLSPNKGHRTLIEAAHIVLQEFPEVTFFVVGKEEEVKITELKQYAQTRGVDKAFVFTGLLDDPRPAIAASDIGVVASTESEVISRAAQEFFAFGVPVVASRVNVLPDMIDPGVNGFLFEPGNAAELASHLVALCRDPLRSTEMGQRAVQRARKFHDLSVLGKMTASFFQYVLDSNQGIACRQ